MNIALFASHGYLVEFSPPYPRQAIENQVREVEQQRSKTATLNIPNKADIEAFAKEASALLEDLNFSHKKAIVGSTIDKIIGTQEKLLVYGHLSLTNVSFFPFHRHRRSPECRQIDAF